MITTYNVIYQYLGTRIYHYECENISLYTHSICPLHLSFSLSLSTLTMAKSKTPTKTSTAKTTPTTTTANNKTTDYVSQKALDNLKYYKYGSADKSYLSYYVLQPYWSWAVQFFPLWMAPNCITLTGLGFMVGNLALCLWTMPDLEGPVDSWIYFRYR